jgi:hypothetical protein
MSGGALWLACGEQWRRDPENSLPQGFRAPQGWQAIPDSPRELPRRRAVKGHSGTLLTTGTRSANFERLLDEVFAGRLGRGDMRQRLALKCAHQIW